MISDRKSTTLLEEPLPTLDTAKKNCTIHILQLIKPILDRTQTQEKTSKGLHEKLYERGFHRKISRGLSAQMTIQGHTNENENNWETRIIIHLHQIRQESPYRNHNQHPNKQQGNILQTRKKERNRVRTKLYNPAILTYRNWEVGINFTFSDKLGHITRPWESYDLFI